MTEEDVFLLAAAEPRRVAYSYVRFSTAKQVLGDSLRRQVQMAEEYCAAHHLELHPVSYRDLGVSAFNSKNLEKGALAAFITAVRDGLVPKGSVLIIEQFDRLSRANVNVALHLLLDLVRSGVTLVTLSDGLVWDKETVKEIGNLMIAIVYMSRANDESSAKARRGRSVWGQKKLKAGQAGSTIVTSECPRWLAPTEDKKGFIVLEDKAESVRKVFEMRIGGYGINSIVSKANREGWPVPGKPPLRRIDETNEELAMRPPTWHTSTVGRMLHNRALLGEYQPHKNTRIDDALVRVPTGEPILGYYPAILDETTFLRAQAKVDRSGRFPGRRDASMKNWLQGLLRCTCGQSFVRKNKDSTAQPGYARYYCTSRNRGLSQCPGANAKELENAVLQVVAFVAPQHFDGSNRSEGLKARADMLEIDVSAAKQTRDRFLDAIGSSKVPVASLMARLNAAEAEVAKAEQELNSVRAELADLDGDYDKVFENIVRAVQEVGSLDARAQLREDLSRVIEKVVVHQADGYISVTLRGVEVPVVQPLRKDAMLPGGPVQGLGQGLTMRPMTPKEMAALQAERDQYPDDDEGAERFLIPTD
jgi:DNA invertase Pin-like site-specific DNA recombinase